MAAHFDGTRTCGRCKVRKSVEEFPLDADGADGRYGYCLTCKSEYERARRQLKKVDGRQFKENLMRTLRKFGLTWEWWEKHPQVCEICGGGPSGKSKRLVFDHCHSSGEFRGVLCGRCNSILGYVDDNSETLRKAAEYLEAKRKEQDFVA